MNRLTRILHWTYYIWIILLPVFSVLYFTIASQTAGDFSNAEKGFLASSFFLVALLNLFLASLWIKELPNTVKGMVLSILWPVLWIGIERLLVPFSLMTYLANLGLVYVMSLALWFTFFLIRTVYRNPKEWWAASLQLLFLIPALGSTYIFTKFLLVHEILINAQGKPWMLSVHLLIFFTSVLAPSFRSFFK